MTEVTTTPATEAPRPVVTVREAAAFGAYEVKGKLPSAEAEKAKATGARLRAVREKGGRGMDVIREASSRRNVQEFTTGQRDALREMFGAGVESPAADSEEGISQETARTQIEAIGAYLDYSKIFIEARNTGKKPEDLNPQYATLRSTALDALSQLNITREMVGDLSKLPEDQRRNVVEAYLAGQPVFRNEVAKRMQALWERAKTLPEEPKDSDYETAKKTKEDAETLIAGRIKDMVDDLQGDSLLLPDDLDTALQALITGDKPTDAILNKLRADLLTRNNILPANIQTFDGYRLLRDREARLQATIDTAPTDAAVQEAQARLPEVQQRIADLEERLNDGGDLHDQYAAYIKIVQATMPQNQGIYSSFGEKLNDAVKARRQISEADRTIRTKETTAKTKSKAWRADRLATEANLNNDLEAVFDDAALAYLEQVYQEAQTVMAQEAEQKIKDAEEAGDKLLPDAIRKLRKKQEKYGVRYNEATRKREINHQRIGEDIRFIAYHGQEGIDRLMLRNLMEVADADSSFVFKPKVVVKDADGNVLKNADGSEQTREVAFTEIGTVDLTALTPESAALFNKVLESQREAYTTKLFADFAIARVNGIVGAKHLRLKDHEYALLEENFGSFLEGKANTPEEIKQAIQTAKEKGPKDKGLLMMILSYLAGMASGAKSALI